VEECEEQNRQAEKEIAALQKELKELKEKLQGHVCHVEIKNIVTSSPCGSKKSD